MSVFFISLFTFIIEVAAIVIVTYFLSKLYEQGIKVKSLLFFLEHFKQNAATPNLFPAIPVLYSPPSSVMHDPSYRPSDISFVDEGLNNVYDYGDDHRYKFSEYSQRVYDSDNSQSWSESQRVYDSNQNEYPYDGQHTDVYIDSSAQYKDGGRCE